MDRKYLAGLREQNGHCCSVKGAICILQACVAYCFITIPSLNGIFSRLSLYLNCGQVALLNNCLTQGKRDLCTLVVLREHASTVSGVYRPFVLAFAQETPSSKQRYLYCRRCLAPWKWTAKCERASLSCSSTSPI